MAEQVSLEGVETVLFEPYFEVLHQRWTHVPEFVTAAHADQLLRLARELPYQHVARQYKQAEQSFERFGLRLDAIDHAGLEWLVPLGQTIESFVQAGKFVDANFGKFMATEVAAQRYPWNGKLTGHRDLQSDPIAIAILSLGDRAYLDILEDDRQTIINTVTLSHGDLVVLGAPGLGNGERPMHCLRVPDNAPTNYERISITYRAPGQPIWDLTYGNLQ